jgi:drug/metabolite transporter (DMT)-like permease/DNA-binding NarL/FixJ family response regulator
MRVEGGARSDPVRHADGGSKSREYLTVQETTVLIVRPSWRSGALPAAIRSWGHEVHAIASHDGKPHSVEAAAHDLVLIDADSFDARTEALVGRFGADTRGAGVPVLVLLRDPSPDEIVRALNHGADDVLPRGGDAAVLRARIARLLARAGTPKAAERRDIDRLEEAARRIGSGSFHPGELGLAAIASERLSGVAAIFAELAEAVHERQRRRNLVLRTIRGALLVLAAGAVFGLAPAIGRISSHHALPPLGVVFWANVVAAVACLGIAAARGGLPRLTRDDLRFLVAWAIVLGCLYQPLTAMAAVHVEASTIALAGSTRGFIVFLLAALLALEAPSLRRFLGLGAGFIAVAAVLSTQASAGGGAATAWMFAALVLPALLAVHTLLMSWRSASVDATAAVGIMMAFSAVLLLPVAAGTGTLFSPWTAAPAATWIILSLGLSTALALVLALCLVTCAGPVFASQMAYSQTLAGIGWGVLLLGESLPSLAWAALAIVIAGFWLVTPRADAAEFRASLPRRARRATVPAQGRHRARTAAGGEARLRGPSGARSDGDDPLVLAIEEPAGAMAAAPALVDAPPQSGASGPRPALSAGMSAQYRQPAP